MKIIDPGRSYQLSAGNALTFIRKDGERVVRDGTTNEEVLAVLIDRVTEAYQAVPCEESVHALYLLKEALAAFQMRTDRRLRARVEGTNRSHAADSPSGRARDFTAAPAEVCTLSHRR